MVSAKKLSEIILRLARILWFALQIKNQLSLWRRNKSKINKLYNITIQNRLKRNKSVVINSNNACDDLIFCVSKPIFVIATTLVEVAQVRKLNLTFPQRMNKNDRLLAAPGELHCEDARDVLFLA